MSFLESDSKNYFNYNSRLILVRLQTRTLSLYCAIQTVHRVDNCSNEIPVPFGRMCSKDRAQNRSSVQHGSLRIDPPDTGVHCSLIFWSHLGLHNAFRILLYRDESCLYRFPSLFGGVTLQGNFDRRIPKPLF